MTNARSALLLHGVGSSSHTCWRRREDLADLVWPTPYGSPRARPDGPRHRPLPPALFPEALLELADTTF